MKKVKTTWQVKSGFLLYSLIICAICIPLTLVKAWASGNKKIQNGDSHRIVNEHFAHMLRPQSASMSIGTYIVLFKPMNWKCLTWTFSGNEKEGYVLQNHYTGHSLKPVSLETGAKLKQVEMDNGYRWLLQKNDDGTFRFSLQNSNLVLTAISKDGQIQLKNWENKKEQRWQLESPGTQ